MRKISTGDVFKMARLIRDSNVMSAVKKAFEKGKKEKGEEGKEKDEDFVKLMGAEFVEDLILACSAGKTEEQLYDLLAGICEKKPDDIRDQSMEATVDDIQRIIAENNVANFLKSASRLSGKLNG